MEAAKDLEWSQSAISHYLSNITDLGPAAIVKFANFLDVDPTEIDPDIEDSLPHVHRINIAHHSSDVTKRLNTHIYSRKNSVSTYIQIADDAQLENTDLVNSELPLSENHFTGVAQICAVNKYPSAKIHAVRLKGEKKMRFYLKNDVPPTSEVHTVWAVIAFLYM